MKTIIVPLVILSSYYDYDTDHPQRLTKSWWRP